jgi:hypothetical protein
LTRIGKAQNGVKTPIGEDDASNHASNRKGDVTTQKERDAAKREEKLALVQEQVEKGTLKIRKMTAKERAAHPPRPVENRQRRRAS